MPAKLPRPSKEQRAEWRQRLAECGFEDAESPSGMLRREKYARSRAWETTQATDIARTYAECATLVAENAPQVNKEAWTLFALGFSIRQVCNFIGMTFARARESHASFKDAVKTLHKKNLRESD